MSKDTFYFPHDYEPTSDPKMSALLGTYGAIGYGLYWRLVEMLHSDQMHKLPLKGYIFISVSTQMLTGVHHLLTDDEHKRTEIISADFVRKFIMDCIDVFELFVLEDGFFYSNRVDRNISRRESDKINKSNAGKASAAKRSQNTPPAVQQNPTAVQQNPTKERKEKKIKENNINKEAEIVFPVPPWAENFKNYKNEIKYPFCSPEFGAAWDLWLAHHEQVTAKKYKGIAEQGALTKLYHTSNGKQSEAIEMIENSIASNWKGIFKEKKYQQNGTQQQKPEATRQRPNQSIPFGKF